MSEEIVEKLRRARSGWYLLESESLGSLLVPGRTVASMGLEAGRVMDADRVLAESLEAQRTAAWSDAQRFLASSERTTKQLERYLSGRRGYHGSVVSETVERGVSRGYVDDLRFARMMTRAGASRSPSGPRLLRAKLVAKGVDPSVVEEALAGFDRDEAFEAALDRLRSLYLGRGLRDEVLARRVSGWMRRRGFDGESVRRAMDILRSERRGKDG